MILVWTGGHSHNRSHNRSRNRCRAGAGRAQEAGQ